MITFKTQEDFDKAVMETLHNYLKVQLFMNEEGRKVESTIILFDRISGSDIDSVTDYCIVSSDR